MRRFQAVPDQQLEAELSRFGKIALPKFFPQGWMRLLRFKVFDYLGQVIFMKFLAGVLCTPDLPCRMSLDQTRVLFCIIGRLRKDFLPTIV